MPQNRFLKILTSDTFFLFSVIGVILFYGLPRIDQMGFGDEPKVYLKPLFALYEDFCGFFLAPLTNTHRPPGMHFLYLPFLWIFGPHMEVIRLLNLFYFCSGLVLFYKIFSRENKFLTKLSLVFIIMTPIFQVYSVQYIGEPQLFSLIAFYLYLLEFHGQKTVIIFCFGVFLGLTRETSLALIPATAVMFYLRGEEKKKYLNILGPLLGSSLYWIFTYAKTGGMFSHLTMDQGHIDLLREMGPRLVKLREIYLATYRLIPLLVCSGLFFVIGKNWKKPRPLTGFVFTLLLAFVFVFSGHQWALPRYMYTVFPFSVYFFLRPLEQFARNALLKTGMVVLILLPPLVIGNPTRLTPGLFYAFQGFQDSWEYEEVVKVHKEVITEIKHRWPSGSTVLTSWPFFEMLKLNYGGYGPRVNYRLMMEISEGELPDVIVFTHFAQPISSQELKLIIESGRYHERTFSYKGHIVRLFEKIASR